MYRIYLITNTINNKKYIGLTKHTIEYRFRKHVEQSLYESTNSVLHSAFRKYGADTFTIKLIDTCSTMEEATTLEYLNIQLYNTNMFKSSLGYNMTDGGEGCRGFKMTEEQRKKISNANKGRKWTKEAREKFSLQCRGTRNHRYGRKLSPTHKAALAKAAQEGKTRNLKMWRLTNIKTNEQIIFTDVKKQCAERNWNASNLYSAHYTNSLFRREWRVEVILE